mgnify:CR=1 FL=1
MLLGNGTVSMKVRSSAHVGHVAVKLCDVAPDGTFMFRDRHHRLLDAASLTSQATYSAGSFGECCTTSGYGEGGYGECGYGGSP